MTDTSKEAVERLAHDCDLANGAFKIISPSVQTIFRDCATTLRAIAKENDELRASQPYTYIGKDGKAVLARDLEDELEKLRSEARDALFCIAVTLAYNPESLSDAQDGIISAGLAADALCQSLYPDQECPQTFAELVAEIRLEIASARPQHARRARKGGVM